MKMRKIADYVKSHMSFSLIGSGVVLFLAVFFFFHGFLQNEYLRYLLAETSKTENALINASAVNISSMLKDAVITCADVAVDKELYQIVEEVVENGETVRNLNLLDIKLNTITHYNNNIEAAAIVTEDGLVCEYGRYWNRSGYEDLWKGENLEILSQLYEKVMRRTENKYSMSYEASSLPLFHDDFPGKLFFHLAYPLVGDKVKKTDCCAVIIFTVSLDAMIQASALGNVGQGDYIEEYITDSEERILYHTDHSMVGKKAKVQKTGNVQEMRKSLDYLGWTVHIDIDTNMMRQQVQGMFSRGAGVYLTLLMVCIIVWQLLLWRILKPVRVIGKFMEKIRRGDFSEKIRIEGTHELWQLAQQYNRTADALYWQRKETKKEFEEKILMLQKCNAAEKEALESQMNAHFLCNTLGAINYSAMENGDTEVSDLLKTLSGILYYIFSKGTKTVTLGEEIGWVRQYLYLQKFRLMDVFDYEIMFPEEYNEWPCCKLFLQPFVENSILHGFEGWEKGGKITITGEEQAGRLVIRIADNGCGMKLEVREKIQKVLEGQMSLEYDQAGVGISNVAARLRMYYGPELEISLETAEGEGTQFTLWLPIPEDFLKDDLELSEEESY